MTPEEILAVAARCETEEPNPYLASAILVAAGHQTLFRGEKLGWEWRKDGVGVWSSMPRPDTSLDAAVTLVPPGDDVFWRSGHDGEGPDPSLFKAEVLVCRRKAPADGFVARARTEPMARCAAALRARAALLTDGASVDSSKGQGTP